MSKIPYDEIPDEIRELYRKTTTLKLAKLLGFARGEKDCDGWYRWHRAADGVQIGRETSVLWVAQLGRIYGRTFRDVLLVLANDPVLLPEEPK